MTTNNHKPLLLGTRRSQLAVAQSTWVAGRITEATGRRVRLVTLSTAGDETDVPIERIGSTGVFVTALREALLAGKIDFVVHSYKDLPTAPEDGLRLAAVPRREDPRDALAGGAGPIGSLDDLPPGARVGTGSPRRAAQILAQAPHLTVVPLRGNVDSRLRKAAEGELDVVVLAMAGLGRLGRLDAVSAPLSPACMLPAPSQGALAIECRADDERTAALIGSIDDRPSRMAVAAERAFLTRLAAGCTSPVGGLAEPAADAGGRPALRLEGLIAAPDGSKVLRRALTGRAEELSDAVVLGERVARTLLDEGGADLLTLPSAGFADPRSRPPSRPGSLSRS